MYGHFADGYENEPFEILDDLMPYIFHIHFKLFEMVEDGEYSMDYKGLLKYLHDHDYDGYVATEYEGNRWTLPGQPMVEKRTGDCTSEVYTRMFKRNSRLGE